MLAAPAFWEEPSLARQVAAACASPLAIQMQMLQTQNAQTQEAPRGGSEGLALLCFTVVILLLLILFAGQPVA